MYLCLKLPPENLNPDSYPSHPISTYTCRMTIVSRVLNGNTPTINK